MKSKVATLAFMLLLGMYGSAAIARADALHIRVCLVLDSHPNMSGVIGVLRGLSEQGFSDYQAGQIIAESAMYVCPEHKDLVLRFAQAAAPQRTQIA